jgi:hypothetical protein
MAEGGQPRRTIASASSSGSEPRREESSSLPTWMKSAIARFSVAGYAENTGMESLKGCYKTLSKYVPPGLVRREHMVHVIGGGFCPVLTLYGAPRYTTANGIYMANTGIL